MANLTHDELKRIERRFGEGIRSGAVVEIFQGKGHRFSEATLRKYVQIGLLPKSRRVGSRGRHRGSSGLYPVGIVRQINDIKVALDRGATLEEVRWGTVGLSGELQLLQRTCQQVLQSFEVAIKRSSPKHQSMLKRATTQHRKTFDKQVRELNGLAVRIVNGK